MELLLSSVALSQLVSHLNQGLPVNVVKDPKGDLSLVVEMNEAYPIDKPDVSYILSQKQDIEEWLDEPPVEDDDDNDGLEYE